jgi:serine/threonine protein phosphatase 1
MKRFCLGDLHGGHKALLQVIERSGIKYTDQLICLGDVCDGWSQVPECFDELLKFKKLIYIIGNHDYWGLQWMHDEYLKPELWTRQGGAATLNAYKRVTEETKNKHMKLLDKAKPYYITKDNKLFVHGGFNHRWDIKEQRIHDLMWDRDLFYGYLLYSLEVNKYDEIFIGHTTTSREQPDLTPVHIRNLWNLDQGGGFEGKLTLLNVDTKEFWQSDIVKSLYPDERGR